MQISSIDWTANDKILSGSYDRSIYVFRLSNNNKWEKDLVVCANEKAVLCG
jgi:actin related protein 2/3 complex subunit 1A/1B